MWLALHSDNQPAKHNKTRKNGGVGCGEFKVGYIVFASECDVDSALLPCFNPNLLSLFSLPVVQGHTHLYIPFQRGQSLPALLVLTSPFLQANGSYATRYGDRGVAELPDEDGWITVTRKTHGVVVSWIYVFSACVCVREGGSTVKIEQ